MMLDPTAWMKRYQAMALALFQERVLLIGLQGSYARGEAHKGSDIDVVLILDRVEIGDLKRYREACISLPQHALLCGFVSGQGELAGWSRAELFHFYYDTVVFYGSLEELLSPPTRAEAWQAVQAGACQLYHQVSHNYLHAQSAETLRALYKSAVFILHAKHFAQTGCYARGAAALSALLTGADRRMIQLAQQIKREPPAKSQLEQYTQPLLEWSSGLLCKGDVTPA